MCNHGTTKQLVLSASSESFTQYCLKQDRGNAGLIRIGYKKPLIQEDLWDVARKDEAKAVCRIFDRIFEDTKQRNSQCQVSHPDRKGASKDAPQSRFYLLAGKSQRTTPYRSRSFACKERSKE